MSKPPIPFAPETQETIQRAFHLAQERRHDVVGLEHLLLAILDEGSARRLLVACGIKIEPLMMELHEAIAKAFTPVPAPNIVHPEPSLGFDRVIQQAMVHAAVSSATQVDTASLLVFLLQENHTFDNYFGTYPGVDGIPPGTCVAAAIVEASGGASFASLNSRSMAAWACDSSGVSDT